MSTGPIPAPRQPLAIEQTDINSTVRAMVAHVGDLAAAVDFAALPATVRCEIMINVAGLAAAFQVAGVVHPVNRGGEGGNHG